VEVTERRGRLRAAANEARAAGAMVGLVPTMGALHGGHERLLGQARQDCDFVAMSIFVNPLQFGPGEDLAAYPRPLDRDLEMGRTLGCDLVFTPDIEEMYPGGPPQVTVDPGSLGDRLEGASRPGHFRGVLTVVVKLFNLAGPCRAYFGHKDAQQLALVRRMVAGLEAPVEIVPVPTVRDPDGVAISSRNAYLAPEERAAAPALFEALSEAATLARKGERNADLLRAHMARRIGAEPLARLDYVAVVDEETWEDAMLIERPARALAAARFGETRLIDNLPLPWTEAGPAGVAGVQNTSGD
jgi:pantoate--beta-alanine ligase